MNSGDTTKADFSMDAYERIHEMNPPKTLDLAAKMAGMQLEFLKPAVMAPTERGLYAGPAACVNRGQIVMVFADRKAVLTIRFAPPKNIGLVLREIANYAKAVLSVEVWNERDSAEAVKIALKAWGGKPGQKNPEMGQDAAIKVIGATFACYNAEQLHSFGLMVDECIKLDVCPAFVCLVGPSTSGKKGKMAIAMLMLPLAPYIEAVI